MIPAQAVEAAVDAWFEEIKTQSYPVAMRAALEAAAPHIREQVYDEGVQAVRDALLAFADERDNALGSIRSHITTYELRKLLGVTDDSA